ncbi:tumor necrosis factor receptor superfamily member 14 isoform X5 [Gadus morhua]|uniref:tumor necrosis factor receptor superfamily member 14 isoform X5 n=1 Tax=Gadus morhua TaxID=8049 RepID=UPI0011B3A25F|nr:tumor necrosis factor receptor superfamily member 14-like isoform X5 [Gadus morhua]
MLYSLMVEANWTAMFISNAQLMLSLYFVILNLNVIGNTDALAKCRQAEYQVEGQCCPTCPAGMHVNRHCTEFRSTSCASCTEGTFQDGDNGREQCFLCKHCDAGLGLKVKKSCSSTSDAVCEVLDGFFCSDSNRGGCRAAQRHTVCSPGQYIGQRGKADKDTLCLHCTDGTFSDGASLSCQNHTKCESVGRVQMKPGTDSCDSECGEHGPHKVLVSGIVLSGVILMASMAASIAIIYWKKKKKKKRWSCWRREIWSLTSPLSGACTFSQLFVVSLSLIINCCLVFVIVIIIIVECYSYTLLLINCSN